MLLQNVYEVGQASLIQASKWMYGWAATDTTLTNNLHTAWCRHEELVSLINPLGCSYTVDPDLPGAICRPPPNPGACHWWLASHSVNPSPSNIIYFYLIMVIPALKRATVCRLTLNTFLWIIDDYKSFMFPLSISRSPSLIIISGLLCRC